MTTRADDLLARAWRRATGRQVASEGFLEDALAAALEHPAVWPALVGHLGWQLHDLPMISPQVQTQNRGAFGRTDIELTWPGTAAPTLIFELKVQAPPELEQVQRYLSRTDVQLVAIAVWSNADEVRAALSPAQANRFLGVVTWTQLRRLRLTEPVLVLRQLHRLLDVMGVAMTYIDREQLQSLVVSLPVWPACDTWITSGLAAAQATCTRAGFTVSAPRTPPRLDHGWYAGWLNLVFTGSEAGQLWAGLVFDDLAGLGSAAALPDLVLRLEIDTRLSFNKRLRDDALFAARLAAWASEAPLAEQRYCDQEYGEWGVLTTRASSATLIDVPDQREGFTAWVENVLGTWAQHGLLERLATLAQEANSARL
jgi:hypothetical protein